MALSPPSFSPSDAAPSETPKASALERLRDRVERAAAEIERLRDENAALAERVRALVEHDALADGEAPALPDIGSGDALREQIEGFIETIDRVLAERRGETPAEDDAPAADEETPDPEAAP